MRILATLGRDSAPVFPVSTISPLLVRIPKSLWTHLLVFVHCNLDRAADCSVYVCAAF